MRVVEAIRQVVRRCADNPAVSDSDHTLSYRSLWAEAVLEKKKLRPDQGPAIIQERRSCSFLVKLLAAWIAGVPPLLLDPCTPSERAEEILRTITGPVDAEYLITTSGSSGKPKVVCIGWGSLHRVLSSQIESFQIDSSSTVGWMLSPGFDASLSDIGTALCAGAHLICAPEARPDRLLGITHLDIPPSLLQVFSPTDMPKSLKTLVVGGEPSPPEILREWARLFRVVSVYGPSETTICSSLAEVDEEWDRPYLGLPLPGVRYRVDEGELLIGGPTVGLGYVGPTPDGSPFSVVDGVRWYRTGDLVGPAHPKFGPSFLGRRDRQVQLRGQRFEPEEVERRTAGVLKGPVVCEVWNGQVVLFWETGEDGAWIEEEQLRGALPQVLMPAWLPQHYVGLPRLPRNQAHKIDRNELIALADRRLKSELSSLDCLQLRLQQDRGAQVPIETSKVKKPVLLVTGATGRLGQALLPHLHSKFDVWSLQRESSSNQTLQADLSLPDFGLIPEQWEFLRGKVDSVLHLAAQVDLTLPLESLAPTNVAPLARLAGLGKPVHYASTLAIPLCTDDHGLVLGGYPQSKWLAEQTLLDTPGLTFRYGHLIGPPRGDELLTIVIRGLLELGCCPTSADPRLCFDWTPLQWAAEETAGLLCRVKAKRETLPVRSNLHFHLNDLAKVLEQQHRVAVVTTQEFSKVAPSSKLATLACQALGKCRGELFHPAFDLFLLGNSAAMLATSSPASPEQLETYVATVAAAEQQPTEAPARNDSPTRPYV